MVMQATPLIRVRPKTPWQTAAGLPKKPGINQGIIGGALPPTTGTTNMEQTSASGAPPGATARDTRIAPAVEGGPSGAPVPKPTTTTPETAQGATVGADPVTVNPSGSPAVDSTSASVLGVQSGSSAGVPKTNVAPPSLNGGPSGQTAAPPVAAPPVAVNPPPAAQGNPAQLASMSDADLYSLYAFAPNQQAKEQVSQYLFQKLGNQAAVNSFLNSASGVQTGQGAVTGLTDAAKAWAGGGATSSGGVVDSAMPPTGAPPAQAGPGGTPPPPNGGPTPPGAPPAGSPPGTPPAPGAPTMRDINPQMGEVQANQTVQGQLADILKTGNPILEQAKSRAMQAANARGLRNSSMASQAGEEAIVSAAMPIAQQDAAAYQKQALVNQDIANQFLSMDKAADIDLNKAYELFKQNNFMFDKEEKLKRYLNDSGISSQEKIAAMQAATQIQAAQISASAHLQAAALSAETQLKATGMNIDAQRLLTQANLTSSEKVNLAQLSQGAFNNYMAGLNNIMTAQMEPEDKSKQLATYNSIWAGNGYLKDAGVNITIPPVAPVINNGTGDN